MKRACKLFTGKCIIKGEFHTIPLKINKLNRMKCLNFCLLAIASFALSSGSVKTDRLTVGYYPGELIPNIVLNDWEGNSVNLNDYKGNKVVVNFWAAYDAQSRAVNVWLYNYLKENNPDVVFLSISFDENKSVFERTLLLDKLESNLHFCEVNGSRSDVYKDFRLEKGFRNYLIDENGVIAAMNVTPNALVEHL